MESAIYQGNNERNITDRSTFLLIKDHRRLRNHLEPFTFVRRSTCCSLSILGDLEASEATPSAFLTPSSPHELRLSSKPPSFLPRVSAIAPFDTNEARRVVAIDTVAQNKFANGSEIDRQIISTRLCYIYNATEYG